MQLRIFLGSTRVILNASGVVLLKGGNTRKLADAVARELGVKAAEIKTAFIDPAADIIFLGSGCYGGNLAKK